MRADNSLGAIAIRARRMQQDQLQAGHTIPPSDNGHQASERPPCCHKESVAEYLLQNLAERESVQRRRHQHCVFSETSSSAPWIDEQLIRPACRLPSMSRLVSKAMRTLTV